MIRIIILFGLFAFCSVTDIRRREIPVIFTVLCGVAGILWNVFTAQLNGFQLVMGVMIGIWIVLTAICTKGAVGIGDGILISSVGGWYGGAETAALTVFALAGAAVFGIGSLMIRRKTWKGGIPLAPFLGAAYTVKVLTGFLL